MNVRRNFFLRRLATLLVAGSVLAAAGRAQGPVAPTRAALTPAHPLPADASARGPAALNDTVALAAFFDGAMRQFVDQLFVSGAVVAVVKDGRVLFAHGYGFSDVEKRTPVDPATSLFRIGSTSKLFTWTALMQLVQQGKVDLDADVNTYLKDIKIPLAYGKPVTVRNLMTHSAGFEDGALGYLITDDSGRVDPIDVALKKHMPARVRPPGTLSSYSNYSAALAGLIIQNVSGIPFNDYIRRNILDPLDMHHATFQEPLPPELKADAVTGYTRGEGVYKAKKFEYVGGFRPAGSGSMSALDMTHFMLAHLQNGRYGNARILDSATTQLMHARTFANDPRLPAMALGFYEQRINGVRFIGHEGDTQYFHTAMFIIPEAQTGIFLSYVGSGAEPVRQGILQAFFDRYFPAPLAPLPPAAPDFAKTAEKYSGAYRFARHSSTKIDKALEVAAPPITVSVMPKEGRLLVTGLGEHPAQFVPTSDGVFTQVEGPLHIAFTTDSSGAVSRLSVDAYPFMGTERVPWIETPSLWYLALGSSALLFISAILTVFYRRRGIKALPREQKRAVWLSFAGAVWFFLTFIVLGAVIASNIANLGGAIPTSLKVALVMPILFVLLTIALVIAAIDVWRRSYWGVGRRIHFTLIVIAAVAVSLFFAQWNMLGWRFG